MVLTPAPLGWLANPSDSLCGDEAFSASPRVRGVAPAGPRSPADLATLAPARGQVAVLRNLRGKSLPAADLPNDAAGESAARVDSLAASPKRTRIRAIRKIQ